MLPVIPGVVSRDGVPTDAIDGVVPRYVIEPESAEAVARVLAWASLEHVSVVLRGRGTKLGWGRPPGRIDVIVSTARLNRVLAHPHGDLTATVEAGVTIADLNRVLSQHGQWLPIASAFDDATVGGSIATNESGPLRHRHGTPRDLLIGIQLATTDGRVVKAGGHVVKNVAGYDLGRLMSGSFGSLAAIVSATFKLAPLPHASSTAVATFSTSASVAAAVVAIVGSQLEPWAFEIHHVCSVVPASGSAGLKSCATRLLVQFASTQAAVDSQVEQLRQLVAAERLDVVDGDSEAAVWSDHARGVWSRDGAMIRLSWHPAALAALMELVERIGSAGGASVELVGRAGVGAGLLRVGGDVAAQVKAIELLRSHPAIAGNVVLLRGEHDVKRQADVWGAPGDTATVLQSLKRTFDPAGILNATRGPI